MSGKSESPIIQVHGTLELDVTYSVEDVPGASGLPLIEILHEAERIFSATMPRKGSHKTLHVKVKPGAKPSTLTFRVYEYQTTDKKRRAQAEVWIKGRDEAGEEWFPLYRTYSRNDKFEGMASNPSLESLNEQETMDLGN